MKKLKLNIQLFAASATITSSVISSSVQENTSTVRLNFTVTRTSGTTYWAAEKTLTFKLKYYDNDNVQQTITKTTTFSFPSNVTTKSKYVDVIVPHKNDGTQSITYEATIVTGTGAGTLHPTGSATLPTLHLQPTVSISSVTETNAALVGVPNTTFVQYLSKKRFVLNATAYDGATITGYSVKNGSTIVNKTTGTLDLNINELYVEANVVPIIASASDSMGAIGSVQQNYANYILYQKPTIEPTSTTTKRNGQTSGRCLLSTMGNYWVGQIGSTTNTPTVKYRYWKKGTTEPSTWNTVPSASVVLNNGRITVTNYEIGSANPSDPNYFDFQFAYEIRVQIGDSFNSVNTLKGITVGEAVWSEYRDRVDFKKLTIAGEEISTLGSNSEGSWIKLNNGIMICYQTNINVHVNPNAVTQHTLTFPQTFIVKPDIVIPISNSASSASQMGYLSYSVPIANITTTNFIFQWFSRDSTGRDPQVSYVAIGKWK